VGGDTTRGPLSLTMTVFGRVPGGLALTRSGARPGDLLCVGGDLGNAAGALPLVLGQRTAQARIAEPLLAHYWSPQPQLGLGQALRGKATSAMDISDGLLADCGHIALASKVGIEVERDRLPLSQSLVDFLGLAHAQVAALSGGDDYVLAFTLPSVELPLLLADGWPIHVVGRVVAGQGVTLLDADGKDITPQTRGYQHFRESPCQIIPNRSRRSSYRLRSGAIPGISWRLALAPAPCQRLRAPGGRWLRYPLSRYGRCCPTGATG
jgi:thiamine-monophosphate kinase